MQSKSPSPTWRSWAGQTGEVRHGAGLERGCLPEGPLPHPAHLTVLSCVRTHHPGSSPCRCRDLGPPAQPSHLHPPARGLALQPPPREAGGGESERELQTDTPLWPPPSPHPTSCLHPPRPADLPSSPRNRGQMCGLSSSSPGCGTGAGLARVRDGSGVQDGPGVQGGPWVQGGSGCRAG